MADSAPVRPAAPASPAARFDSAPPASSGAVDQVAAKVSELSEKHAALTGVSREVIEMIAWEVVPQLAEVIIRELLAQHPEWIRK